MRRLVLHLGETLMAFPRGLVDAKCRPFLGFLGPVHVYGILRLTQTWVSPTGCVEIVHTYVVHNINYYVILEVTFLLHEKKIAKAFSRRNATGSLYR